MIPDNALSTQPVSAAFIGGRSYPVKNTVDYESGGVALGDLSQGLLSNVWRARVSPDRSSILLATTGVEEYSVLTDANITEVSFTFDQNMRPVVAYVASSVAKLYWYDSSVPGMVTTVFSGIKTPRVSLDDKRDIAAAGGWSDVIFAYMRGNNLYFRQQRDRFGIEYLLAAGVPSKGIIKFGMNAQNRLQFLMDFV